MKDKKKAAAGAGAGLAVLAVALAIGLGAKKVEAAPPEKPIVGEEAKYVPVIRHPDIPPEQAYVALEVLPHSQEEQILSLATGQPLVSVVIDIEETDENREYIEAIEDTEEARLMALPNGGQCTTTFLKDGNYYACCNGYAILTIKAKDPEKTAALVEQVKETGTKPSTAEQGGLSWMEKEQIEQERTGYTQTERYRMVYDYRIAHPGVSGPEASETLFG